MLRSLMGSAGDVPNTACMLLCTDKTGTLTEGVVRVEGAYDPNCVRADDVLELGAINASLETGLPSPLDDAILAARTPDLSRLHKLAEIPFDFVRKRVSVVVDGPEGVRLVARGSRCSTSSQPKS